MKLFSVAAVLVLALFIAGCAKQAITGDATIKATGSLDSNATAGGSNAGGESEEVCYVDGGVLGRILSGHGSL